MRIIPRSSPSASARRLRARSNRVFERIGQLTSDVAAGQEEIWPSGPAGRAAGGLLRRRRGACAPRRHDPPCRQGIGKRGQSRDAAPAFGGDSIARRVEPGRRILDRDRQSIVIGEQPVERTIERRDQRGRARRRWMQQSARSTSPRRLPAPGRPGRDRPSRTRASPGSPRRVGRDRSGHVRTRATSAAPARNRAPRGAARTGAPRRGAEYCARAAPRRRGRSRSRA